MHGDKAQSGETFSDATTRALRFQSHQFHIYRNNFIYLLFFSPREQRGLVLFGSASLHPVMSQCSVQWTVKVLCNRKYCPVSTSSTSVTGHGSFNNKDHLQKTHLKAKRMAGKQNKMLAFS